MKKIRIYLLFLVTGLYIGCADPDLAPVLTFEDAGKGAYVALIEEGSKLVNLFDISGSQYTYSVEFVDLTDGSSVAEYYLDMSYVDKNPGNGDESTSFERFRSYSASEFQMTEGGYMGVADITVTADELITAAGTSADQVMAGDQFLIKGYVVTEDGAVFGADNSSASVNGAAFRGHFDYTLAAGCPSTLAGTYPFEGFNYWCGAGNTTGEIEIIATGGGSYTFNDWSLGAYPACYGGLAAAWGTLAFTDVCAEVSFTGFTDNYGDTWTFVSSVDGDKWTIDWENTYGEAGSATITNPNGDWPFVIVE